MEDWKKKYEVALVNAERAYKNADESGKRLIESMFPQFRESEDERIRKWLIEEIKATHDYDSPTSRKCVDDALAYLEKQKINTEGDFARGYDCGYECCLHSHGAEWFEKQKESLHIPETCKENANSFTDEDERRRKWIVNFIEVRLPDAAEFEPEYRAALAYLEKQKDEAQKQFNLGVQAGREEAMYEMEKEQKSAEWSKENAKMLESAIAFVEHSPFNTIGKGKNNVLAWLKSLPERFNLQPKQEWSEEDKIRLKEALEVLDESIKYLPMGYGFTKDVMYVKDWLKSLRPQPHWKPSDEQMESLREAGDRMITNEAFTLSNRLFSLYYDLEKL